MATIDSLDIQITADAKAAVTSLKNLSQSLQNISYSLQRVNSSGFNGLTSGINSLTSAMEGYAKAEVKTADFTRLATQLNKVANVNSSGLTNMSSAINKLASSTDKISSLGNKTAQLSDFAKSLSKLGGANIAKAVENIPRLANAMRELLTTLSQSPNVSKNVTKLTRALADLTKNMGGIRAASNGSSSGLRNFTSSAEKTTKASKGLASAIGKVYATYWMLFRAFGVLRKAVDYASSLTEVQNVVEQTFGQATKAVDIFAQEAKDSLGMSELTVKQIASRYQAMGGAMDISSKQIDKVNSKLTMLKEGYINTSKGASGMSLTLTKLAGDMASFYDKDQAEIAQDLEAVYTGMTRPLRKYGLDLTQATLQEYANKRGIEAKVSSMTQAEKTMLRYQYVMENTTKAQGDFLRTADTWANQVKIMKQNFISLGTTIGQVFINAFKPWLKTLNNILVAVNKFAIKIANALGNIFGWRYEVNDVGLLSDFEDDASELADDFGSANKEAKKLKATIMGYDELNVMQEPKDKDGGSGSGSGLGGLGGKDLDDSSSKSRWVKYKSEIDNLFDLGRTIADTLQRMMENIDWDSIYEKARGFGKGLAEFLNGLFKPEMFYQIGRTIAGCLNTALHFLDSFAEEFDFEQFGLAIAESINGFFENFDFALLAHTINKWVNGIYTTIRTIVENIKWDKVWEGIKDFLSNIDISTVSIVFGALALKYGTKILTAQLIKDLILKKLNALALSKGIELSGISLKIAVATVVFAIGQKVGVEIGERLADDATKGFFENFHWLGEGGFFDEVTKDADITLKALKEMFSFDSIFGELKNGNYSAIATYIVRTGIDPIGTAWQTTLKSIKFGLDKLRESSANASPYNIDSDYSKNFNKLQEAVQKWQEKNRAVRDSEKAEFGAWCDDVSSKIQQTFDEAGKRIKSWWTNSVSPWFTKEKWQGIWDNVVAVFNTTWTAILSWWKTSGTYKWFNEDVKPWFTKEKWINEWNNIKSAFNTKWNEIMSWWKTSGLYKWFNEHVKPWFTVEKWQNEWNNVKSAFSTKWNEIVNWWRTAISDWFNEHIKPWFSSDRWSFSGIRDGLTQAFENAISGVKSIFNNFVEWINSKLNFSWEGLNIGGRQIFDGGSINLGRLPTFATGGFPEDGLFMANHSELVGQFSNGKTAVANNQQITEGIRQAVMDGMMQVIMATSGNNSDRGGDINLYLDGRVIAQTTYNNLKTMGRQGVIPKFI